MLTCEHKYIYNIIHVLFKVVLTRIPFPFIYSPTSPEGPEYVRDRMCVFIVSGEESE